MLHPMLAYGAVRAVMDGARLLVATAPPASEPPTAFLMLQAFSAGCTALTGIEAISNGVPAFQPPKANNIGWTLMIIALLVV